MNRRRRSSTIFCDNGDKTFKKRKNLMESSEHMTTKNLKSKGDGKLQRVANDRNSLRHTWKSFVFVEPPPSPMHMPKNSSYLFPPCRNSPPLATDHQCFWLPFVLSKCFLPRKQKNMIPYIYLEFSSLLTSEIQRSIIHHSLTPAILYPPPPPPF